MNVNKNTINFKINKKLNKIFNLVFYLNKFLNHFQNKNLKYKIDLKKYKFQTKKNK